MKNIILLICFCAIITSFNSVLASNTLTGSINKEVSQDVKKDRLESALESKKLNNEEKKKKILSRKENYDLKFAQQKSEIQAEAYKNVKNVTTKAQIKKDAITSKADAKIAKIKAKEEEKLNEIYAKEQNAVTLIKAKESKEKNIIEARQTKIWDETEAELDIADKKFAYDEAKLQKRIDAKKAKEEAKAAKIKAKQEARAAKIKAKEERAARKAELQKAKDANKAAKKNKLAGTVSEPEDFQKPVLKKPLPETPTSKKSYNNPHFSNQAVNFETKRQEIIDVLKLSDKQQVKADKIYTKAKGEIVSLSSQIRGKHEEARAVKLSKISAKMQFEKLAKINEELDVLYQKRDKIHNSAQRSFENILDNEQEKIWHDIKMRGARLFAEMDSY